MMILTLREKKSLRLSYAITTASAIDQILSLKTGGPDVHYPLPYECSNIRSRLVAETGGI